MKIEKLLAIQRLSQKNPKWIHRDIFRILNKDEIWIAAYEKIKRNKGAVPLNSTLETIDRMSLDRLKKLQRNVYSEKYKFKPVKLTYIQQANGKKRPLGLPTANDKIVQEVIRIILEAIYEPVFVEESFGFRPGLGCHDALHHVEQKFRWVDYVVEGDIEQAYLTIYHHALVEILQKRIDDHRFIRLIWKLLKCGVLEEEQMKLSKTGVLQGSIVLPILTNIYYHELDEKVQALKRKYETLKLGQNSLKNQADKALEYRIEKVSKEMRNNEPQSLERQRFANELKQLRSERLKTESLKTKTIRIEYVRYADNWMVGVSGDKKLAYKIKDEISSFMKEYLLQNLHPTKTKVTNLRKGNAHFLKYDIFLPRSRPISSYKGKGIQTIRRKQPRLRFDVPVAKVIKRYVERGYLKQLKNTTRPISKGSYTVLEDHVIVSHYRRIWLGLLNYYSGCTNRGRLQYIHYLLHMSCAMTLGHRHRMSCSKIFKKHGKTLEIKIPDTDKTVSFPYKMSWKLSERRWFLRKEITLSTYFYAKNLVSRSSL